MEQQDYAAGNFILQQCMDQAKEMANRPDITAIYIWQAYVSAFAWLDTSTPDEEKIPQLKQQAVGFMRTLLRIKAIPFVEVMTDEQVMLKIQEMFNDANTEVQVFKP